MGVAASATESGRTHPVSSSPLHFRLAGKRSTVRACVLPRFGRDQPSEPHDSGLLDRCPALDVTQPTQIPIVCRSLLEALFTLIKEPMNPELIVVLSSAMDARVKLRGASDWGVTFEERVDLMRSVTMSRDEVNRLIEKIVPKDRLTEAKSRCLTDWHRECVSRWLLSVPSDGIVPVREGLCARVDAVSVPAVLELSGPDGALNLNVSDLFVTLNAGRYLTETLVKSREGCGEDRGHLLAHQTDSRQRASVGLGLL